LRTLGETSSQRVELLRLCGLYKLVSSVCNAAELKHEEWAAVSSSDGQA